MRRIDDDDLEDDGDEHYDEESSLNHAKSMNGEGFVKVHLFELFLSRLWSNFGRRVQL